MPRSQAKPAGKLCRYCSRRMPQRFTVGIMLAVNGGTRSSRVQQYCALAEACIDCLPDVVSKNVDQAFLSRQAAKLEYKLESKAAQFTPGQRAYVSKGVRRA